MSNTTPAMSLTLPDVGVTPGPEYATLQNQAFETVDQHDHTLNRGNPVPSAGLNINADLPINGNSLTGVKTVRLNTLSASPTGSSDLGIVFKQNNELCYRDGNGAVVVLTSNGSIAGASGSITGLTSPASAVFNSSTGTFYLNKDTSLPGKLSISDLIIAEYGNASSNPVTIKSPPALGAAYTITLPPAVGAIDQTLISDSAGALGWTATGRLPLGAVVATFPNLSGAYVTSASAAADYYGFVPCNGQTIVDASSPMNGATVPNINGSGSFLRGSTASGATGGSTTSTLLAANIPQVSTGYTPAGSVSVSGSCTGATLAMNSNNTHHHSSISGGVLSGPGQPLLGNRAAAAGSDFSVPVFNGSSSYPLSTDTVDINHTHNFSGTVSASGTLSGNSTTITVGNASPSAVAILPTYITGVYLMRIK